MFLPLNRKDLPKGEKTALVDQVFKKCTEDYLVSLVGKSLMRKSLLYL